MLATDTREVPVSTLRPGDGFELLLDSTGARRKGYVAELGAGSAVVMLLDRTSRTIRTTDGREVVIESATGLRRWSLATPVVPDGERYGLESFLKKVSATSNRDARREAHVELPEKGDEEMKAKKKAKKVKKAIANGSEKLYELLASKVATSKFAKAVEDKETKKKTAIVVQSLGGFDRPATFDAVVDAVKKTGRFKHPKGLDGGVKDNLAYLVREGLVKVTKVEKAITA